MRTHPFAPALLAAALLASSIHAAPQNRNLQVIDKNISKDELKKMMEGFAAQLGVKCQFCHVDEQYEKDDKKQKGDARKMIKLVMEMKSRKPEFFKTTVKETAIQCSMCHRGRPQPEAFVP
ncbi:MAG: c-type cytochrome [Vicinamibacteria bacterium]|nr:c-type cytochrome [Vicinamibacteria bacterium]